MGPFRVVRVSFSASFVIACCAIAFAAAAGASRGAEKQAPQWEYAELQAGAEHTGRVVARWITSAELVDGETWQELARRLGVPPGDDRKAPEPVWKMKVFNHLGSKGWELAGTMPSEKGFSSWTFKRKLEK
jgi:hypothetical protein